MTESAVKAILYIKKEGIRMHLREATAQDAQLISRMIAASWRGAYQDILDPVYLTRLPEDYWLPTMRTWLESERMYGLIAEAKTLICSKSSSALAMTSLPFITSTALSRTA